MDKHLIALIEADTPKINPAIGNGLATLHLPEVEGYINDVFKSAARGFPQGLTYKSCKRCTPEEEFAEITKLKANKRVFDVARSDIYMMKYQFSFNGKDLPPRYMYLPFVGEAGTLSLGGSRFVISPILSDRVISVGVASVFVRLLRDRLTFERMAVHYMEGGRRRTVQVAWALIYHKPAKHKKIGNPIKANCTMMHYLLCKYGFKDTFLKFGNCAPVVGGVEITAEAFPPDEWVICSSTQVKPKNSGKAAYEPSRIRVAVRRSELTPMVSNMLGGFFYVVDFFPTRMLPEFVDSKRMWMILMGHIIFSGNIPEGRLANDIEDHIASLDEYLDSLVIDKLEQIGVPVKDVYALFAVVIEHLNDWLLAAPDKVASMYDKELSILYYVLYNITSAIFKLYFKLKAASKKELTEKEIITIMNLTLRTGLIYSIVKNHGEVSTQSVSGDNKAFKLTSMLVPQGSSSKIGPRKERTVMNDPSKRLHPSIAEVGGYSNLPKSQPDGRARLNPCVQFDEKGVIVRNPERIELLDQIGEMIKRS